MLTGAGATWRSRRAFHASTFVLAGGSRAGFAIRPIRQHGRFGSRRRGPRPDEKLCEKVSMTDPSAGFDELYRASSRRLLQYAYAMTGDLPTAQDITQEAFIRAWRQWRQVET